MRLYLKWMLSRSPDYYSLREKREESAKAYLNSLFMQLHNAFLMSMAYRVDRTLERTFCSRE